MLRITGILDLSIWYSKEHNVLETGFVSIIRWKGIGWKVLYLLGPLERANLNHGTTYVSTTTTLYTSEIRVCQWDITGKFTTRTVEMHL
jgi:hypothetical protein